MGKLTGTRYLFQRRGRYFVRVRVPQKLSYVWPGRPFLETFLGTADKGEARDRVDAAVAEIKDRFKRAREGGAPRADELDYHKAVDVGSLQEAFVEAGEPFMVPVGDPRARAVEFLQRLGLPATDDNLAVAVAHEERIVREAHERHDRRMPKPTVPERPAPRAGSPEALGSGVEAWLETKRTRTGTRLAKHSVDVARMAVRRLAERFPRGADVTKEGIETWCRELRDSGLKGATLHRLLPLWRDYWRFLKGDPAVFTGLKIAAVEAPNKEPFEREEVLALIAESKDKPRLHHAILIAAYMGLRREEIAKLKPEDVNLQERWTWVRGTKSDDAMRKVPTPSILVDLFTELKRSGHDWLIEGIKAKSVAMRAHRLGKDFRDLNGKLGFRDRKGRLKTFHNLRHSYTTALARAKVDRDVRQQLDGHKVSDAHGTYVHADMEMKRDAIERIAY